VVSIFIERLTSDIAYRHLDIPRMFPYIRRILRTTAAFRDVRYDTRISVTDCVSFHCLLGMGVRFYDERAVRKLTGRPVDTCPAEEASRHPSAISSQEGSA